MSSDSWTAQFESEEEFRRLDRQADECDFLHLGGSQAEDQSHDQNHREQLPEIPGYTLHEVIGEGGTSLVVRATAIDCGEEFAIKLLNDTGHHYFGFRLRREVRALTSLDHPGIAKLVDYGITVQGQAFLVLQLIGGQRIDRYCREHDLTNVQSVAILSRACQAVAHAHDNKILHRDLKPANILVEQDGQPVITDFGLAKLNDVEPGTENKTHTGALLGTLNYLAPEQIHGPSECVDERTDVFGFGAVLHVLLVGRPPFQFDNVVDAFARYYDSYPVRLQSDQGVPAGLEAICIKCLSPKQDDRYQTVDSLQRDLDNFLTGNPVEAKRQLFRRRLQVFSRQYPWFVRTAVATTIGIFLMAIAFLFLWQRSAANLAEANRLAEQRDFALARLSDEIQLAQSDPATLEQQRDLLFIISESYRKYPARRDDSLEVLSSIADTEFKLGQVSHHLSDFDLKNTSYQRALDATERVLDRQPDNENALFRKFHCLIPLKRYERANRTIDRLIAIAPSNRFYLDAKVTTASIMANTCLARHEFEAARRLFKEAAAANQKINVEAPLPIDIRRNCKVEFLEARLAIDDGNLDQASAKLDRILEDYLQMGLEFPTDSECGEFFYYLRAAMSLALFRNDAERAVQLSGRAREIYGMARQRYRAFTHYRLWYLLTLYEYEYWLREDTRLQGESVLTELIEGILDWRSDGSQNDDYFRFIYLVGTSDWSDLSEILLNHLGEARALFQGGGQLAFAMYAVPRDPHRRLDLTVLFSDRLKSNPREIQARWFLSRLGHLQNEDESYLPEELSTQQRRRILAQSNSYLQSQLSELWDM